MANAVYPEWKELLLDYVTGGDLNSGNVKLYLIDLADYTYSAAHAFLSSASAGIVATSGNLGTKTISNGTFDAADSLFTAVTGDPSEALILAIDTGSAATSPLVAYWDTGVTGLPVTPNGGDINFQFNASGLFTL